MNKCINLLGEGAVYILLASSVYIVSCNKRIAPPPNPKETGAASVLTPNANDTTLNINLSSITNLDFPKYKIVEQQPIVPDSVSIALDEETVTSGNYSALLNFTTAPSQTFYESIEQAAKQDTCWKINKDNYTYNRKDKQGGMYRLTFNKGSMQISVSHLNADMIKDHKH